jgi:hypothetical protein
LRELSVNGSWFFAFLATSRCMGAWAVRFHDMFLQTVAGSGGFRLGLYAAGPLGRRTRAGSWQLAVGTGRNTLISNNSDTLTAAGRSASGWTSKTLKTLQKLEP